MNNESQLRTWVDWLISETGNGILQAIRPILERNHGIDWEEKKLHHFFVNLDPLTRSKISTADAQVVFKLVKATWSSDFEPHGWGRYIRQHITFFIQLRNAWAHYEPISEKELLDAFGRAKMIMRGIGDSGRLQLLEKQEEIIKVSRNNIQGQMVFEDGSEADADLVNSMPQLENPNDNEDDNTSGTVWSILNQRQRVLVRQRNKSGYRRVKGSAGSGKTVVIVARAIQCASEGMRVLVVAYNKTMVGFLKSMIRGCAVKTDQVDVLSNIECRYYHGWCLELINNSGMTKPTPPSGRGTIEDWQNYNHDLGKLAQKILSNGTNHKFDHYDAVMVDEGQDFYLEWWQSLRLAVKQGEDENGFSKGEMLLAADTTQDLYGTASAWTDEAMIGAGFRGPWFELQASYRMPPALIPLISIFVDDYLPHTKLVNRPISSDANPESYPFSWTWKSINSENGIEILVSEVERIFRSAQGRKIVVQVPSTLGLRVVESLSSKGIESSHIFDYKSGNTKESFVLQPGIPGVITPHSFKGCEAPLVVVWIDTFGRSDKRNAAYVALTRVQRHEKGSELVVLNMAPELARLPEDWKSLENGFAGSVEEFY